MAVRKFSSLKVLLIQKCKAWILDPLLPMGRESGSLASFCQFPHLSVSLEFSHQPVKMGRNDSSFSKTPPTKDKT